MVKLKILGALSLAVVGLFIGSITVESHHTGRPCGPGGREVCLPLQPTVAVNTLRATGELTWCVNARANSYPNFVSQIHETNNAAKAVTGFGHRQIPGTFETDALAGAAGCQVWHSMPPTHGCSGCAAWVHYANWPVIIEYKWQLGYTDWKTTIGHEMGHVYGLHEHYDDDKFLSHRGTYGYWAHGYVVSPGSATDSPTVMDFGTGQWALQPYDVKHICQLVDRNGEVFVGCGFNAPPPPPPCVPTNSVPCWTFTHTTRWAWLFENGVSCEILSDGGCNWYAPDGQLAFTNFHAWGGWFSPLIDAWIPVGNSFFKYGAWHMAP